MTPRPSLLSCIGSAIVTLVACLPLSAQEAAPSPAAFAETGPFFEPGQPLFHTQVEVTKEHFVVRGVLLPLPSGHAVLFDQELLRVAAIWLVPAGQPPVSERTMAQISYKNPRTRTYSDHPQPTGPLLLASALNPGAAPDFDALFSDPRPPNREGDAGRGPLPETVGRFEGVELTGPTAVLRYRVGQTLVREWFEARDTDGGVQLLRHLEIAAHATPLHFALGRPANGAQLSANSPAVTFTDSADGLVASLAPAKGVQRITFALAPADAPAPGPTPAPPALIATPRWPGTATAEPKLARLRQNGWVLDHVPVPEVNPWKRRIRPADLAFVSADEAAVVTYDGDVWRVTGLADPELAQVTWRRFASGLHEPLAIAAPLPGAVQVWTKNGLVRLADTDANGEADRYDNFNDHVIQSQTTRSFPLDMAIGPDGSTYVSQGGITTGTGIQSGGTGTPHAGAILKISPDGRSSEVFARAAREPFVTVHPRTGTVTGTDQQGHFVPASVGYVFRKGDNFGFPEATPEKLTPPLVWIPHAQDTSSASQVWTPGEGFGIWSDKLLHLSYGRGRLFLISPDFAAPTPQGAVIPLGLETDLPLLHGRRAVDSRAMWFAGFQIWGTRTKTMWSLGRLRPDPDSPIVTPVAARSNAHGVVLTFARPLDPASVTPLAVQSRAWNYFRSAEYGSGYYTLDGRPGTTPQGVSQTVLSADGRSVFIHLPNLTPAMQLELKHDFKFADGGPAAPGVVFFTVHQLREENLAAQGFPGVDLNKRDIVERPKAPEQIAAEAGQELAVQFGCAACHFPDPTTRATIGPTWLNLYNSRRRFTDGTTAVADEAYLREKIREPMKRRVTQGMVEMPSYAGVLTDAQIESLVLYIKSLSSREGPAPDRPTRE
ncbi:c-type cytochrome [Oleiharenicola lentus]|uniref:C-type cytochrome n=1 Tax=Oleiharenicola lentus TaxID=2508720 RepID=A0A4Q1C7M0_9BACT|nr:DUF6797 domain-containing protein [Oleiharenicola lentus]RXK54913.1 c-type cytochrome [Oleiharenicola lentus]